MRITKRTNIAVRLLMYCAANVDRLVTKAEIADCCNISENHLAQVINQLSQLGYLHTQRGRNGGMTLGRQPEEIQIGDVFRDVEGALPMVECFADADNLNLSAGRHFANQRDHFGCTNIQANNHFVFA